MKKIFSIAILLLFLVGCAGEKSKTKSDPPPVIYQTDDYLMVNDHIFNKKYIIYVGVYDHTRTIYKAHRILIRTVGSTADGFLGGAPSASSTAIFRGTRPECVLVLNQIRNLLELKELKQ